MTVGGTVRLDGREFSLKIQIRDPAGVLKIPKNLAVTPHGQADELWKTTCAELFLGAQGDQVLEFNFSPDGRWNVYLFDQYRKLSAEKAAIKFTTMIWKKTPEGLTLEVSGQDLPFVPRQFNATFVAEVAAGVIHLAPKHPAGKPDFHRRDLFLNATRD